MCKQELPFHMMKKCLWHARQMECEIASGKEVPRDLGFKMQFLKECKQTGGFQTVWHSEERRDFNWSGVFPLIKKVKAELSSRLLPSLFLKNKYFSHVTVSFYLKPSFNLHGQKALLSSFFSLKLSAFWGIAQ